jgi:hypothetical protein
MKLGEGKKKNMSYAMQVMLLHITLSCPTRAVVSRTSGSD